MSEHYYKLVNDARFRTYFFNSYEKLIRSLIKGGHYIVAIQHTEMRDRLKREITALGSG